MTLLEIFGIVPSVLVYLILALIAIKKPVDRCYSNCELVYCCGATDQAEIWTVDSPDPPIPPLRPSQSLIAEGVPDPDSADEFHDIIQPPMDIFSQKKIADLEAKLEQALIYGRLMRTKLDSANERGSKQNN